jgi:hypothetical protein
LVTLGILIGLRAESELRVHFTIALQNGLTREDACVAIADIDGDGADAAAAELTGEGGSSGRISM